MRHKPDGTRAQAGMSVTWIHICVASATYFLQGSQQGHVLAAVRAQGRALFFFFSQEVQMTCEEHMRSTTVCTK